MTADEADAAFAGPGTEGVQETAAHDELSLRRGGFFAVWVAGIMLAEQTLLNGGVLTVDATSHQRALAGIVFNVLLIARAPLQLFQAVQTSLLPHLTGLEATAGHEEFSRAIRTTVKAIAAFAGAVALGLLLLGPWALGHVLFGQNYTLRPRRPGADRDRDGLSPLLGGAQPGGPGPQPRAGGGGLLAGGGVRVHRLDAVPGGGRRGAAGRDRIRRGHRRARRPAAAALPPRDPGPAPAPAA